MKRILIITASCLLLLFVFLAISPNSGDTKGGGAAGVQVGIHSANFGFDVQPDGTHQRTHVLVLNEFPLGAGSVGHSRDKGGKTFSVSHQLPRNRAVSWEFSTATGKMTIDQLTYDAANGRVFTIRQDANGTITAAQLNIDPTDVTPTVEAIREFVKKHQQLPWFDSPE